MAVWQFHFLIVPKDRLIKQKNTTSGDNIIQDREIFMSWEGYLLSEESIKEVSEILKMTRGWDDSVIQFGSTEESCIELYYEKGILSEISCRLDLRSITFEVLDTIINFIKENKAIIVTDDNIYVEPIFECIVAEIKKSNAYRFCKSPNDFFNEIEGTRNRSV